MARTQSHRLPTGLRAKRTSSGKTYYYLDLGGKPRKWLPLGSDYFQALRDYSEKMIVKNRVKPTILDAWARYQVDVLPHKAPRTAKDNVKEFVHLSAFFCDPEPAPLDEIEPGHVSEYMQWRSHSKTQANLEKALLSHLFNCARAWGMTSNPNPCAGLKKFKLKGREEVYVDDETFNRVWEVADQPLRYALDLAYLTGQRVADVLEVEISQVTPGWLSFRQNKTSKALRLRTVRALESLLQAVELYRRRTGAACEQLLVKEDGQPLTRSAYRYRFDKAREKAGVTGGEFQFRDLRGKVGTDVDEKLGIEGAKDQLGHASASMTRSYVRNRRGKLVDPTA